MKAKALKHKRLPGIWSALINGIISKEHSFPQLFPMEWTMDFLKKAIEQNQITVIDKTDFDNYDLVTVEITELP